MAKKVKKSTEAMINDKIAAQRDWRERRSAFARRYLNSMNVFADDENADTVERHGILRAYWFPILCLIIVLIIAAVVVYREIARPSQIVPTPVPEPVIQTVNELTSPSFDIVRIEQDGNIVVAGRWTPYTNISILMNKKIVATIRTDANGEFAYAPTDALAAGNYTLSLVDDRGNKSENQVFLYVSEHGYQNSVSLLMTNEGSSIMQSPTLVDGDLVISKIDYLDTGRIVITGNALPRLRVSLKLDGKVIGMSRVSDHRHFGIGADVGELESGREYTLIVRLHDGDNRRIATVSHTFTMPQATGADDTFYTVRRGDALWIIARNFLRRGVLFSIIADANNITNPNLIFPKQKLQIPVK